MSKMNKKVKAKWVKALKSGEFKQGKNTLKNNGKYCCLGVLCELYRKETGKGKWKRTTGGPASKIADFHLSDKDIGFGLPANGVCDWAGLKSKDPLLGKSTAANHNDGTQGVKPKSFKQIAALINKYL